MTTVATGTLLSRMGGWAVDARRGRKDVCSVHARPFSVQIGAVPVALRCAVEPAMSDFRALYAGFERPVTDQSIDVEVIRVRRRLGLRPRFEILAGGAHRFTVWDNRSLLPHIEWAINWEIMLHLPRFYEVHAGVLEVDGQGVILPAAPGSGKTTLTAALAARGWRYLSDEFALIDPETLSLHPYPKALCVKEGSFDALERVGLLAKPRREYLKGKKGKVTFISPNGLGPGAIGGCCPVRHIIFCRYEPNARPVLTPISRAAAVLRLTQQSFNFLKFRSRGIEILAGVVRGAQCYELLAGPLEETRSLVERAVRSQ